MLGNALAQRIRLVIADPKDELVIGSANAGNIHRPSCKVAVFLVNMAGERLGSDGDFTPWQLRPSGKEAIPVSGAKRDSANPASLSF